MGGFKPVPLDDLPMPQAAAPVQYQPAQMAPPPSDPNQNPGIGYMKRGGQIVDVATNFLNGWMTGKQKAEEKKVAMATQQMQGLHYGFQIAQANAQAVMNDPKATPEQKQQAEQARQAAWKAYLDGAEQFTQPQKGSGKSGGKKDGGGVKGHLKQAFGAEDPILYAQAGLGLLRKTGPPPLAQPSPQDAMAKMEVDDKMKIHDAVDAAAKAQDALNTARQKGASPEEISNLEAAAKTAQENVRTQWDRVKPPEKEQKPQTAKERYDAAYAADIEGGKDPEKDPVTQKWKTAMKEEAEASKKASGSGDHPETKDFDGYLQQYDPENKLPGEHKNGWVKLGKSKKDAEGPSEKGTWKLMRKDGKPVWQNDKTLETRPAEGFTPEGEDNKLQVQRDKVVGPLQDSIDSMDSANDYLNGKTYSGTGDYDLMLNLQQAITAGKKSGIRFTAREQDMVNQSRSWYDSWEAKALHALKGTWYDDKQRKEIVETMNSIKEKAQKQIERYDKEHPNPDRPQSMGDTPKEQKYTAGDIVTGPDGKNHKVIGYNDDGTLKLDKNVEPD